MEVARVGAAEAADQGVDAVGVFEVEGGVLYQRAHAGGGAAHARGGW